MSATFDNIALGHVGSPGQPGHTKFILSIGLVGNWENDSHPPMFPFAWVVRTWNPEGRTLPDLLASPVR